MESENQAAGVPEQQGLIFCKIAFLNQVHQAAHGPGCVHRSRKDAFIRGKIPDGFELQISRQGLSRSQVITIKGKIIFFHGDKRHERVPLMRQDLADKIRGPVCFGIVKKIIRLAGFDNLSIIHE